MFVPAIPSAAALVARKTDTAPVLMTVCAWHTTKVELDRLNQQYPGAISHGLCDVCARRMEQEVA